MNISTVLAMLAPAIGLNEQSKAIINEAIQKFPTIVSNAVALLQRVDANAQAALQNDAIIGARLDALLTSANKVEMTLVMVSNHLGMNPGQDLTELAVISEMQQRGELSDDNGSNGDGAVIEQ